MRVWRYRYPDADTAAAKKRTGPRGEDLLAGWRGGAEDRIDQWIEFKAFVRSRRPAPNCPPFTGAACESALEALATPRNGLSWRSSEAAPATCGELKDVPQATA